MEGYRVYRGRVDTPSQLRLVAQFDYAGTAMLDWRGQLNPTPACAPELGINSVTVVGGDTAFGCPVPFDSVQLGVAATVSDTIPLVGQLVQVKLAPEGRQALATGTAIMIQPDTAVTGAQSGCVAAARGATAQCTLRDTGVPFAFVDHDVRNDFRYFYAVTAFDVNSLQSGPSSLESPRRTKAVTPVSPGLQRGALRDGAGLIARSRRRPRHGERGAGVRSRDRALWRAGSARQRVHARPAGCDRGPVSRGALRLGRADVGQPAAGLGLRARGG